MNEYLSPEQSMGKKERRELHRQERETERLDSFRRRRTRKIIAWISVAALLVGVGLGIAAWARRSETSLPGVFIPEQGRAHIAVGADHDPYTSNPPTSGPHYPDAIKAGVYDEPVAEEYLVHNMEHGHVILWYHCPVETPAQGEDAPAQRSDKIDEVLAGEPRATRAGERGADDRREDAPAQSGGADDRREDAPAQSGGADDRREDAPAQSGGADEGVPATENVKTGAQLREGCADAVTRMTEMARDEFDSWKVVVVPGPNLDTRFALTAWTRLDKFEDFDEERVRRFIKAYRNKGPEATAE